MDGQTFKVMSAKYILTDGHTYSVSYEIDSLLILQFSKERFCQFLLRQITPTKSTSRMLKQKFIRSDYTKYPFKCLKGQKIYKIYQFKSFKACFYSLPQFLTHQCLLIFLFRWAFGQIERHPVTSYGKSSKTGPLYNWQNT